MFTIFLPLFGFVLRPAFNHPLLAISVAFILYQLATVYQEIPQCKDVMGAIDAMGNTTMPDTGASAVAYLGSHIWPCLANTLTVAAARVFSKIVRVGVAARGAM